MENVETGANVREHHREACDGSKYILNCRMFSASANDGRQLPLTAIIQSMEMHGARRETFF